MGRKFYWTATQEARLLSLAPQATPHELAQTFGVTRYAIETKLADLGVRPKQQFRWTLENVDRLRSLLAVDTPVRHIAQALGCSIHAAQWQIRRLRQEPERTERICAKYPHILASGTYRESRLDRMIALSNRRERITHES